MAFSIRLTEQEKKIVDSYARLHSISLGEAFKQALFEKIEEEYDLAVFDDAYDEYKDKLSEVAEKLLEVEQLSREEFEAIFPPPVPKNAGIPKPVIDLAPGEAAA